MNRQLVIFGTGSFAEVAHYVLTRDSTFDVVAFCETPPVSTPQFRGLPVISFDEIATLFPPSVAQMFVAIGYARMNGVRAEIFSQVKEKGYRCISYVSSRTTCWDDLEIGENCFIFEDNTLQPFVRIGDNVVMWSGNHIGHHATIADHCFITSHVVVSGNVTIGERCFLGVNATLRDDISIADRCLIGPGALIMKDTAEKEVYMAERAKKMSRDSDRFMR